MYPWTSRKSGLELDTSVRDTLPAHRPWLGTSRLIVELTDYNIGQDEKQDEGQRREMKGREARGIKYTLKECKPLHLCIRQ